MFLDSAGRQYVEPVVRLALGGDYDSTTGEVQLGKLQLASSGLALGAAGRVGDKAAIADRADYKAAIADRADYKTAIADRANYNDVQLGGQFELRPRPPERVAASLPGRERDACRPRLLDGLVSGAPFAGRRSGGSQPAVGPGQRGRDAARARRAEGHAGPRRFASRAVELMLNQGRVHLAPRIGLVPALRVSLPAGPRPSKSESIRRCARWRSLRCAGPGQRHRRQGHDFHPADSCHVPGRSGQQRHSGRLVIHSLEMESGPMLHALSVLVGGDAPAQLRQGSVVAFRMKDRRVYHDGLRVGFPALTVRTSGSVGLDRTMDLTAEMPVPPRWLGNNAAAIRAVASQTIRLPLAARWSGPARPRALQQASRAIRGQSRQPAGKRTEPGPRQALRAKARQPAARKVLFCGAGADDSRRSAASCLMTERSVSGRLAI